MTDSDGGRGVPADLTRASTEQLAARVRDAESVAASCRAELARRANESQAAYARARQLQREEEERVEAEHRQLTAAARAARGQAAEAEKDFAQLRGRLTGKRPGGPHYSVLAHRYGLSAPKNNVVGADQLRELQAVVLARRQARDAADGRLAAHPLEVRRLRVEEMSRQAQQAEAEREVALSREIDAITV